jgi:hypothetical protein
MLSKNHCYISYEKGDRADIKGSDEDEKLRLLATINVIKRNLIYLKEEKHTWKKIHVKNS